MKLTVITLGILIGITFAAQNISVTENNQKIYATNLSLEFVPKPKDAYNQFTVCPRDFPDYKQLNERYDYENSNTEGATVFVRHCEKCNIGVYSEHVGEDTKRCTYCGQKELSGE